MSPVAHSIINDFDYQSTGPNPRIGASGGPTTYTLSATVNDDTAAIVEYRWDVGDGTYRYGSSVNYTYPVAKVEKYIRLRVTDAFGNQGFCFTVLG